MRQLQLQGSLFKLAKFGLLRHSQSQQVLQGQTGFQNVRLTLSGEIGLDCGSFRQSVRFCSGGKNQNDLTETTSTGVEAGIARNQDQNQLEVEGSSAAAETEQKLGSRSSAHDDQGKEKDAAAAATSNYSPAAPTPALGEKEEVGKPKGREDITSRLRRLSATAPEDFTPTSEIIPEELKKAKMRYRDTLDEHKSKFARDEYIRRRNPNYGGGGGGYGGGGGGWGRSGGGGSAFNRRSDRDDHGDEGGGWRGNSRWISTSARIFQETENTKSESIIDRLKRMSQTPGSNYQLSGNAQKLRQESEMRRMESQSRGARDEDFDQRSVRPFVKAPPKMYRGGDGGSDTHSFFKQRSSNRDREDQYHYGDRNRGNRASNFDYRGRDEGPRDREQRWNNKGRERHERRQTSDQFGRYGSGGGRQAGAEDEGEWESPEEQTARTRYRKKGGMREYDESYFLKKRAEYQENQNQDQRQTRTMSDSGERSKGTSPSSTYQHFLQKDNAVNLDQMPSKSTTSTEGDGGKVQDAELDLTALLEQDDGETFGTLSLGASPVKDYVGTFVKKELMEEEKSLGLGLSGLDEAEEDDTRFIPEYEDRWNMKKLTMKVRELVDGMQTKEAVDTLIGALDQGGFQFNGKELVYTYNLCISSCAQVGYVKMAFKLFNDMKKRGFHPKESTYTSLFNACANSSWDAEHNYERMNNLRMLMSEKGVAVNQIMYHSMIKGYGRNGYTESAFAVVDEMIQGSGTTQIQPNTETFNMLLQACITNKENGFRHLLVTWRKMHSLGIRPDIFSFNLLLRGVRDCGIQAESLLLEGEDKEMVLKQLKKRRKKALELKAQGLPPAKVPAIISDEDSNDMLNLICVSSAVNSEQALVNFNQRILTDVKEDWTYLDLIEALAQPQNRLAILGGLRGVMSQLSLNKVGPNLKTVTELAEVMHPTEIGDLLQIMKTYKLKPDITFFNMVMRRCCLEGAFSAAKRVLTVLPKYDLSPDIITWGVASTGCKNHLSVKALLAEMDAASFMPRIQIMGAFLHNASVSCDPRFVLYVMNECVRREVQPDSKFVLEIENFKQTVKTGLLNKEMGKPITPPILEELLEDSEGFEEHWKKFLFRYEDWMKTTKIQIEPRDPFEKDFETFRKHRSHKPKSKGENENGEFETEDKHDDDEVTDREIHKIFKISSSNIS